MSMPVRIDDELYEQAKAASDTANAQLAVVRKSFPANNLKELTDWLKANPDKASQGTAGAGSALNPPARTGIDSARARRDAPGCATHPLRACSQVQHRGCKCRKRASVAGRAEAQKASGRAANDGFPETRRLIFARLGSTACAGQRGGASHITQNKLRLGAPRAPEKQGSRDC